MKSKFRIQLAAALFLGLPAATSLVAVPAHAQSRAAPAPEIEELEVNANRGVSAGSTLRFTVRGTPRGKARVQLQGSKVAVPLRETARGVYSAAYTVRQSDRIDPNRLIRATLSVGSRTVVSDYSFPPAFIALANNAPAVPPRSQAQAQSQPQPPVPPQVQAQPQPQLQPQPQPPVEALRIERFSAAPVARLEPGTELRFTLSGNPGAMASFEVPGVASGLPMRETRPGFYVGSYTLRQQDNVTAGPVVATLRSGDRWVTAQLPALLVTDTTAPVIGNLSPRQGDVVPSGAVTTISGSIDDAGGTGVDPRSVRVSIAGRDVTPDTQVTPQTFSYRGTLSPGRHTAEVSARDLAGNASQKSWTFEVGSAAGPALSGTLPLQVVSPGANAAVNGSDVVIQGRTAPGANVRVKVDAVAPASGNRASVAQLVTQQSIVADANGNFSFTLGAYRGAAGTRYEVSMLANQGTQTAEQRLVLFQRPG
jgi:hypothetical protein